MKIKFGDSEFDLDKIVSIDDMIKFAEAIPPQKKSDFVGKERGIGNTHILFDQCTEKETALRNLALALTEAENKLRKKLFPSGVGNVISVAKQCKLATMVITPPVDTEDYALLQKISYAKSFFTQYVATLIQSRVGFGLNLLVNNSGQIYCLQDLRELYTASV